MKHNAHKGHPHHKGPGMAYFHKPHWEHKPGDVTVADGKYSSEMNQNEEYKHSVDALASYAKKHRAQH